MSGAARDGVMVINLMDKFFSIQSSCGRGGERRGGRREESRRGAAVAVVERVGVVRGETGRRDIHGRG